MLRNAALVWATRAYTYTYLQYPGRVRASHTTSASSVAGRVTLVQSLQKRSSITLQNIIPGSSLRNENVSEKAIQFL